MKMTKLKTKNATNLNVILCMSLGAAMASMVTSCGKAHKASDAASESHSNFSDESGTGGATPPSNVPVLNSDQRAASNKALAPFQEALNAALDSGKSVSSINQVLTACPTDAHYDFCVTNSVTFADGLILSIQAGNDDKQAVEAQASFNFATAQGPVQSDPHTSQCLKEKLAEVHKLGLTFKAVDRLFNDTTLFIYLNNDKRAIWSDFATGKCDFN